VATMTASASISFPSSNLRRNGCFEKSTAITSSVTIREPKLPPAAASAPSIPVR
jgi:hypothetical protein